MEGGSPSKAPSECRLKELGGTGTERAEFGAVFWPSAWRTKLCSCVSCKVCLHHLSRQPGYYSVLCFRRKSNSHNLRCIHWEPNGLNVGGTNLNLPNKKRWFSVGKCFATVCTNEYTGYCRTGKYMHVVQAFQFGVYVQVVSCKTSQRHNTPQ